MVCTTSFVKKLIMNRLLIIVLALCLLASCSKEPEQKPEEKKEVIYKNLGNKDVDYENSMHLDLNDDGTEDLIFAASVIENYLVEKLEFRAYTLNGSQLLSKNMIPKVFNKDELITSVNNHPYEWSSKNAFLAYRLYTDDPSRPAWEGAWMDKTNKYLGVKIKSPNAFHTGWVRISAGGMLSKLILHDYAYNKVTSKDIKAGEAK